MSQFTDYGENKLVIDRLRGQASPLGGSLYAGLASAADDGSVTEITGTGYGRQTLARALATWAGTQGPGTTIASAGTTHTTSNNAVIDFGTAGSAWGAATHLVIHTAASGGNAIAYLPLPSALSILNGDPVAFPAASIAMSLGLAGGCSDFFANKLIDDIFRGQAYTFPATLYHALFTAAPVNAGGGTEASGTGYGRQPIDGSLTGLTATQGGIGVSTGSSGVSVNNAPIEYNAGAPLGAAWGTPVAWGLLDAASAGNLLVYGTVTPNRSLGVGSTPPRFAAGALAIRAA